MVRMAREKEELRFTVRFLFWLLAGVAIVGAIPSWSSVPASAVAIALWGALGIALAKRELM